MTIEENEFAAFPATEEEAIKKKKKKKKKKKVKQDEEDEAYSSEAAAIKKEKKKKKKKKKERQDEEDEAYSNEKTTEDRTLPSGVAIALPVDVPPATDTDISGEKQGAKCCGCCCDYRRAVIVMAIVGMCSTLMYMIMGAQQLSAGKFLSGEVSEIFSFTYDDDIWDAFDDDIFSPTSTESSFTNDDDYWGTKSFGESLVKNGTIILGASVAAFFFYIFQLVAALKYNLLMLYTVVVFELITFGFRLYFASFQLSWAFLGISPTLYVASILSSGFTLYPTVGLIMEIKQGIMSAETYPREEYSCCCTKKV